MTSRRRLCGGDGCGGGQAATTQTHNRLLRMETPGRPVAPTVALEHGYPPERWAHSGHNLSHVQHVLSLCLSADGCSLCHSLTHLCPQTMSRLPFLTALSVCARLATGHIDVTVSIVLRTLLPALTSPPGPSRAGKISLLTKACAISNLQPHLHT